MWRELRRISNAKKHGDLVGPPKPVLQDPRFEAARFAADNGIFRCYLQAMGGALATRAEHPIKLAHLIEEQANAYGEDIKRLMGPHCPPRCTHPFDRVGSSACRYLRGHQGCRGFGLGYWG